MSLAGAIIAIGLVIFVLRYLDQPTKTWKYRKNLTDLYVSGKLRAFATKDNIDLEAEARQMKRLSKVLCTQHKDIDDQIESKIVKTLEKEIEEKSKAK